MNAITLHLSEAATFIAFRRRLPKTMRRLPWTCAGLGLGHRCQDLREKLEQVFTGQRSIRAQHRDAPKRFTENDTRARRNTVTD